MNSGIPPKFLLSISLNKFTAKFVEFSIIIDRKITPQEKYNLSPELIDLFKNNNKLDYKLYSLAKQIYQP